MTNTHKLERNPKMSVEEFEEANTDYFTENRLEDNPQLAYLVNEWDLDAYYEDIDWDHLRELMVEQYELMIL